jgi:WD40 repeat protein
LCEPHDDWFLFRGGKKTAVEFVRIIRRCSPRTLNLRERPRVLVAVAEPLSTDVAPFDAPLRLKKLSAALAKTVDIFVCGPEGPKPLSEVAPDPASADPAIFAPYTKTTRAALRTALAGTFDVIHLLAHGHGAGVLLCTESGTPAETTASELGEWCGAGQVALAFLQVCKAGQSGGRGGFGGVAQQLLNPRGGNLAAVVASTFPLDAEHSTDAAVGFYRQLAAGKPPVAALTADRPESDFCWAFLELWARPGALGGGTQQRAAFQFVSPYRGLSSFGEQDADLFFGRKTEVTELLNILRTEPVIAVVGDSGSGKTSLLQAGLVHAVRREGLAGSDRWKIVSLRPGYRPAQALVTALGGSPAEPTPEALKTALRADAQPLMIIFDQFEELFTLARDKAEVSVLTAALADAVEQQRDRFRLVLGMRSEFLGQAASVRGLSRLIRRPWVLRPPGADDLRAIVAGPAESCGYTFQGPLADGNPAHAVGLLDRILADPLLARDKDGATAAPLPLLQFALERLWLKAVEKGVTEFTHAEFDEIGGMGKAIAQHAEAVYQGAPTATELGSPALRIAEQVITALVSTRETRQPRSRAVLQEETGTPDAARAVVDYLVGERLLTVRTDPEDMTKSLVDLSHEALIHNWDRLRGWLAEDPQGRAMREEFRTAAEKWENGFAGAQPRSWFALPGVEVARNYLAWIETSQPRLAPVQQEFAQALRAMLVRNKRVRRAVMGALAGLALVALVFGVVAVLFADRAQKDKAAALQSEKDAKASEAKADAERVKAEEQRVKAEEEKRNAQLTATSLALEKGIDACVQGYAQLGVLAIAYSLEICPPNEPHLRAVILTTLAAWAKHLLYLEDVRDLKGFVLATDASGKFALLELSGKRLQLYDLNTFKPVGPDVPTDGVRITSATVLSDGTALLSGGVQSSVREMQSSVRNMLTGRRVSKWIVHPFGYTALSPDAKRIAVGAETGDLRIWDVETGTEHPEPPFKHQGRVTALAFSADGRLLATGCGLRASDLAKLDAASWLARVGSHYRAELGAKPNLGVVHLYNVNTATGKIDLRWRRPVRQAVTAVQISPDNRYVAGGSFELHIWQVRTDDPKQDGELLDVRSSPENTVQIAFDPAASADFIATSPSGGIKILRGDDPLLLSGQRLSPQGWLAGAGFRADGRIFTVNDTGIVRIWRRPIQDVHAVTRSRVFNPRKEAILCVAFRGDGRAFALGSRDGFVYVYDLEKGGLPKEFRCAYRLTDERHQIADVRFSTDGSRVIARDDHLTPFVFEVAGGPDPISGKHRPVGIADDGKTVLVRTAGASDVFQVSDVGALGEPTGPKLVVPEGLMEYQYDGGDDGYYLRVARVAFTPDRSLVALVDGRGAVHVFRTATGESLRGVDRGPIRHDVNGISDNIRSVAFGPVGELLVTRSDKARGLWSANTGDEVDVFSTPIGVQVTRFSPSGRLILAGTNYNRVHVWDRTGREVPMPGLLGARIWGVAANRAETRIVTACADKTALIWDLATHRPVSTPLHHGASVSDAAFSPDGTHVLTGSWDGTARLWEVPEPLPDDKDRIIAWVETMTGLKVGPVITGDLLTPDEWRESKRTLDRLGGPPIHLGP